MNGRLAALTGATVLGIALSGCSSSSSSSTTTTTKPAASSTSTAPGTGLASAQAVGDAYIAAVHSKNFGGFCAIAAPGQEQTCIDDVSAVANGAVTYSNWALGTVTVQGDQAIINFTGTGCSGEQCASNGDPNSAQSDGTSFAKAFSAANNPNDPNSSPFATSAVRVDGQWYASGF